MFNPTNFKLSSDPCAHCWDLQFGYSQRDLQVGIVLKIWTDCLNMNKMLLKRSLSTTHNANKHYAHRKVTAAVIRLYWETFLTFGTLLIGKKNMNKRYQIHTFTPVYILVPNFFKSVKWLGSVRMEIRFDTSSFRTVLPFIFERRLKYYASKRLLIYVKNNIIKQFVLKVSNIIPHIGKIKKSGFEVKILVFIMLPSNLW